MKALPTLFIRYCRLNREKAGNFFENVFGLLKNNVFFANLLKEKKRAKKEKYLLDYGVWKNSGN